MLLCVVGKIRYDGVRITNTGTKTIRVVKSHYPLDLDKHSQMDIRKLHMIRTALIILT